jgi:hypothetical protein
LCARRRPQAAARDAEIKRLREAAAEQHQQLETQAALIQQLLDGGAQTAACKKLRETVDQLRGNLLAAQAATVKVAHLDFGGG